MLANEDGSAGHGPILHVLSEFFKYLTMRVAYCVIIGIYYQLFKI